MAIRRRGGRHALNRMNPDTRITVAELVEQYQSDEWWAKVNAVRDQMRQPYQFESSYHLPMNGRVGVEIDGRVHIVDGDTPIDPIAFTADMAKTLREFADSFVGQPYRAPDGRMFSLDDGHPPGFMGTDAYQRDEPLPASGGFRPSTVAALSEAVESAKEMFGLADGEGQPGGQH